MAVCSLTITGPNIKYLKCVIMSNSFCLKDTRCLRGRQYFFKVFYALHCVEMLHNVYTSEYILPPFQVRGDDEFVGSSKYWLLLIIAFLHKPSENNVPSLFSWRRQWIFLTFRHDVIPRVSFIINLLHEHIWNHKCVSDVTLRKYSTMKIKINLLMTYLQKYN
jgi:hypothetical protein